MKKILISFILAIIMISMITTAVYAATGNITASSSASTVLKGKSFTVTITGNADSDITGLVSDIEYDKNILKLDSINPSSGFANLSDGTKIEVASTQTSEFKSGTIVVLNFTVLDTTTAKNATINIKNGKLALLSNQVQTNVENLSTSVSITIKEDETTAGGGGTSSDKSSDSESGSTPTDTIKVEEKDSSSSGSGSKSTSSSDSTKSSSTSSSSSSKSSSSSTKKLPQTGLDSTVVIAIVALTIFGIVSYISYRKYKKI